MIAFNPSLVIPPQSALPTRPDMGPDKTPQLLSSRFDTYTGSMNDVCAPPSEGTPFDLTKLPQEVTVKTMFDLLAERCGTREFVSIGPMTLYQRIEFHREAIANSQQNIQALENAIAGGNHSLSVQEQLQQAREEFDLLTQSDSSVCKQLKATVSNDHLMIVVTPRGSNNDKTFYENNSKALAQFDKAVQSFLNSKFDKSNFDMVLEDLHNAYDSIKPIRDQILVPVLDAYA